MVGLKEHTDGKMSVSGVFCNLPHPPSCTDENVKTMQYTSRNWIAGNCESHVRWLNTFWAWPYCNFNYFFFLLSGQVCFEVGASKLLVSISIHLLDENDFLEFIHHNWHFSFVWNMFVSISKKKPTGTILHFFLSHPILLISHGISTTLISTIFVYFFNIFSSPT